ncbi:MAG: autotransporter outer membrane beta-barrel domain-containing protein [Selenomonas sp.]|nr:autotransporter outer membrane beta-barrel domain-containing protein [Selenomonas sp.]
MSIFLLSGGYTLPSLLPVYAAPVTGQNVTVDASHPAVTSSDPTNTPAGEPTHLAVAAGDAPAGNVGDVTGNSLTIQATSASTMSGILNLYAGRTLGAGNANGNTLTIDGRYSFPALIPNVTNPTWPGYPPLLYAGYTRNGNADGNTVIIRDVVDTGANQPNPYAYPGLTYSGTVYAGYTAGGGTAHKNRVVLHNAQALGNVKIYGGNNPANRSGNNVLQITSKNNRVAGIYGFKTMEFVLNNNLKAADSIWSNAHLVADYMLYVRDNTLQSFDWDQIVVKNYQSWFDHQIALGKKRPVLYLYFPSAMTLYGYAPTLLYNNGDYEYGKTATSYTNGAGIQNPTGIVAASQFRLLGLRYKNATETLTAQTPQLHESSPKGSYAGVSIYGNTTENNKLTISGGTHTAARAGYTIARTGSTKNNPLTITGGTVGEAYGGWTEGQNLLASTAVDETHPVAVNTGANAEAEGNKLNLSGGTIGANGKIAGGYIAKYTLHQSHLVSAGDVKTNKVNISGGTIGNNTAIYGGYTEGSGNATDNEVTISDGTFGNGVAIHGGATAGRGRQLTANPDVANDTVTASKATGNTVTITGGTFGTGMDIYGGSTGGTGAATGNAITLGANDLAMGGVFLHGGYGAASSDVMTDNTLNVKGKNITVRGVENFGKANFDLANKAVGDTLLKITGGATNKIDWAGVEVVQSTYSFTPKSYDKRLFTLMDNEDGISFMKGTTDTYATIGAKDRTFGNYEFVIDTDNHTGHATRYVYADGFQFKDNTAATYTSAEGTHDAAWAGRTATGNKVEGNKLTVTGGSVTNAYGGFVVNNKRDASGNPLTTGDADSNTLILAKDAANPSAAAPAVTGSAYGALVKTKAGSATNNKVDFSAGHVAGSLYGGALTATGATGAATGNTITITGAATVGGDVYGGYADAVAGAGIDAATDNTIDLYKATISGVLYGGAAKGSASNAIANGTGNTLSVRDFGAQAGDFTGVQNLYFYIPEGTTGTSAATAGTMLTLNNVTHDLNAGGEKDLSHVNVGVQLAGNRPSLKVGDAVSLMKVYKDNTTDAANAVAITSDTPLVNKATGMQGISLRYNFDLLTREAEAGSGKNNELYATVTSASINPDTKSLVETRAASLAFLTSGSDLLTDAAMTAAMEVAATPASESQAGRARVDGAPKEYRMWAVQNVSSMRLNSGSHVDAKGWGLNLGFAKQRVSGRNTLTYGPFVEYGKGSYDSYLDDGLHGSGNMDYLGVGVMAKSQSENGSYVEGSVRVGRVKSDYAGTIDNTHTTYDSSSTYYAGHLGVGQEKQLKNGNTIETYAKYFFTHQGGDTAKLSTGEVYDFDAADSHRIRFGTRYTSKKGDASFYTGLAYEYEFGNDIVASFEGYNTPSPSLTGGTGILELGYRFTPQNGRATYGIQLMGMTGKRRGISGGVQMHWAF